VVSLSPSGGLLIVVADVSDGDPAIVPATPFSTEFIRHFDAG
jgi:hypothetical protein